MGDDAEVVDGDAKEEKAPKEKASKKEAFKCFQPATPGEMNKVLKFYECSPFAADPAVQMKLPGLRFESDPDEQLWRMIATKTWSIHERVDQKKIHIHMTCLDAKIFQVILSPSNGPWLTPIMFRCLSCRMIWTGGTR
jgi:hypothetical protein